MIHKGHINKITTLISGIMVKVSPCKQTSSTHLSGNIKYE